MFSVGETTKKNGLRNRSTTMDRGGNKSSSMVVVVVVMVVVLLLLFTSSSDAVVKRCFSCRSRGELGSCKDRFKYTNLTHLASEPGVGVEAVPCASGWCGKIVETRNSDAKEQEFDTATQRTCLQRGPSDSEERCSDTVWEYKKVFMCFCHGDLCNGASPRPASSRLTMATFVMGPLVVLFARSAF